MCSIFFDAAQNVPLTPDLGDQKRRGPVPVMDDAMDTSSQGPVPVPDDKTSMGPNVPVPVFEEIMNAKMKREYLENGGDEINLRADGKSHCITDFWYCWKNLRIFMIFRIKNFKLI